MRRCMVPSGSIRSPRPSPAHSAPGGAPLGDDPRGGGRPGLRSHHKWMICLRRPVRPCPLSAAPTGRSVLTNPSDVGPIAGTGPLPAITERRPRRPAARGCLAPMGRCLRSDTKATALRARQAHRSIHACDDLANASGTRCDVAGREAKRRLERDSRVGERPCQVAAADPPPVGGSGRWADSFRSWLGRTGGGRGWRVHGPPRYGAGIARGRRLC
jgi:hypothetical protein